MFSIAHANIKDWAKNYDGPLFDGILCDPPYELGFMGKSWDSSGIAFDSDMWADLFKLVKPGGHLLAFSGSRTYHRMAVAIEDAGFEIRDMIEWVYGSGFPKSLNIGKAVDKIQGNEREVVGEATRHGGGQSEIMKGDYNPPNTKGTSPYEGYGTALKPAHEPCVLARKPIEGTVANNVLKHGTGGLNIDGTRVGTTEYAKDIGTKRPQSDDYVFKSFDDSTRPSGSGATSQLGRFPANLIHDGSDEVKAIFPDSKSSPRTVSNRRTNGTHEYGFGTDVYSPHNDSGNSSRFFYCAKASKSERNAGLEGFEDRARPTMGSGIGGQPDQQRANNKNVHPTVKPLSLTKYLATLIKPPTGGRLLVPFSGSGSEMIGALQAGWEYVQGVELTEEYIPIAEARIKHWVKQPVQETLDV